jgi:hypothetical protein
MAGTVNLTGVPHGLVGVYDDTPKAAPHPKSPCLAEKAAGKD